MLTTAGHRIEAGVFVTSHPMRSSGAVEPRAAPRMAHVVGLRVPRASVPRALYWESSDSARWVRLRSQGTSAGEVLLVGGEDPAGDDDHTAYRYLALEEWARSRFPGAGEVVQRFTGQVVQTPDLFAMASRGECDSESVYVSTGDWGTAMTRGTIAGLRGSRTSRTAPKCRGRTSTCPKRATRDRRNIASRTTGRDGRGGVIESRLDHHAALLHAASSTRATVPARAPMHSAATRS